MNEKLELFLWSLLFTAFVALLIAVKMTGRPSVSASRPPGPTPLSLLGNLLQLSCNPHRSLAQLTRKHGPVMALKLGSVYTVVVSSPSTARQVLQTRDRCVSGRHISDVLRSQGYHEVSVASMPTNKSWKSLRSLTKTQIFSAASLDAGQSIRRRKIRELNTFIKGQAGQAIFISRTASCTLLNLISTSLISIDIVDVNSGTMPEFLDLVRGHLEESGKPNISDFFPLLAPLDLQGRRRRFKACFDKLSAIFDRIVWNRLEGERTLASDDCLDVLLKYRAEDGSMLSIRTITSFLIDSFAAGSYTSATTVEWAMAELLHRPELMERVRLEIEAVIGSEREVYESDMTSLPFCNAVLKETLRLHPPVPLLLPHRAEVETEINGYRVPKGSRVLVNAWAIGRDERVWENPDCFLPERFMHGEGGRSEVDFNGQHFELIPFGSGRRMCPGLPLATRMVLLILASFIQCFKWELPEGMAPADLDLRERLGVSLAMASPLRASGIPRYSKTSSFGSDCAFF